MNTFGRCLRLTTFGESHGPAMGGVLDGLPPGLQLNLDRAQRFVDLRAPGRSGALATARCEADHVEWLSGLMPDGLTLGTPIGFIVRNADTRPADYSPLADKFRPSHADYAWHCRYRGVRDIRGGGRSSARETVARVAAGALALQALKILCGAEVATEILYPAADDIAKARAEADSLGAVARCTVTGLPAGVGTPVFGKLSASLAEAMMSIPAAKAFEIGMGVDGCRKRGSEVVDEFVPGPDGKGVVTATNNSGGLQGGITNGMPVVVTVHFKPIATLPRPLRTVDAQGRPCEITMAGRHDPSVAARVAPVVTSMAALACLDAWLDSRP